MNIATQNNNRQTRARHYKARRRARMIHLAQCAIVGIILAVALFLAGYGDSIALHAGDIH